MKFCPTCEARYDEEIMRFCTIDGTPLVDEDQPDFTGKSSESIDVEELDFGEETVIRVEKPSATKDQPETDKELSEAPRIVIPMTEEKQEQKVRARTIPPYQSQSPTSNTGKVVALTVLGTLGILVFGLGLFWLLQNDDSSNTNVNINTNPPNVNLNANLNPDNSNFNFNFNSNFNTNFNTNINTNVNSDLKTPSPTPKPSLSPTPTLSPTLTPSVSPTETPVSNTAPPQTPRPTVTSTPIKTPTPTPAPTPNRDSKR